MFFFGLLFRGWRYDYIHISTGPEESHYVAIPRIIGFYLCSKLYGKKIILMVRNILPYISNSKLAYSTSRYRSIESIKMFSFESDTLRREFVRNVITPGARYCVTYGKYSNVANNNVGDFGGSGSNMRVGLLGSVDCDRRDYDTIINALSLLSVDHVRLIEFVVLGRCPGGKNNEIIKRLSEVTNVDVINENLTEDELTKGGLSCDILIAPLIKERLYGRLKGTGAFSDAIYLHRRMIVPEYVDPDGEFVKFCYYYSSSSDLSRIFYNLISAEVEVVNSDVWDLYSTHNVLKSLSLDLRLPCSFLQSSSQIMDDLQHV
jgi:hypothetical protein